MEPWLRSAVDYIGDWLEFQLETSQQPGCIIAVVHRGKVIAEHAFGVANLDSGEKLTARHRFRIASHSKAFTAAGLMKLRERRKLKLDDSIGQYVKGLHPQVAEATIAQVLSHSAGLTRDGADSGQFVDSRPYLNEKELLAELRLPAAIEPNTRFKYSNHGFGLLGLVIEAVTAEPYPDWIKREIVEPAGLQETEPNMPIAKGTPFARGHSRRHPLGRRVVIPGDNSTHAITSAAGFVSTAADTARFFAQLAPNAARSVLSAASRREMTRKQWRIPQTIEEAYYGFGLMSGQTAGWDWFGHGGGLSAHQAKPVIGLLDGLRDSPLLARHFPAARGRQHAARSTMGNHVIAGNPHLINPFLDAAEIEVTGRDTGRIVSATGYANHGEGVRRSRNKAGTVTDIWLAGGNAKREKALAAEMERRYAPRKGDKAKA